MTSMLTVRKHVGWQGAWGRCVHWFSTGLDAVRAERLEGIFSDNVRTEEGDGGGGGAMEIDRLGWGSLSGLGLLRSLLAG